MVQFSGSTIDEILNKGDVSRNQHEVGGSGEEPSREDAAKSTPGETELVQEGDQVVLESVEPAHPFLTEQQQVPEISDELPPLPGLLPSAREADLPSGSTPIPEAQSPPTRVVGHGYWFNDRYVVDRELGQGGMGKVFLASDKTLGRRVAVKVIRPQDPHLLNLSVHREEYARAFLKEAKVGAELDHPNIAKVFDYGIDHGEPFTVFEYIEGETLQELLARRGRLSLEDAQDIVGAVAEGLACAHASQIVHRDLKPANIRITPQGVVKILDLGLAARYREEGDWRYCGTPRYMAPEQAASKPCDGRTDQYPLAVITYELVTGQLPFTDPNEGVLLQQQMREPPPHPRQFIPDLPERVAEALLRALAKKPDDRFDTWRRIRIGAGMPAHPATRGKCEFPPLGPFEGYTRPSLVSTHMVVVSGCKAKSISGSNIRWTIRMV